MSAEPRILWVTNDLPPRAGGIQQFVHNLLVRVAPSTSLVLGPGQDGAAEHDPAQPYAVLRRRSGVWPTPAVRREAIELVRRHDADVVVLGATWPLGELGGPIGEATGVPVVGITHGLEAGLARAGGGHLIRRATRGLAAATAITAFTEDALRPHVACRLDRLPPGVDPEVFHPSVDGGPLRERWGIPPDALLVGCVSRLVPRKGQDRLLDVWERLAPRHPDSHLVIVGGGPAEASLRARATGLPRAQVVGAVSWAELPAAYAALDVFAMPCRTRLAGLDVEGLGIVYLEAGACGVPVVAGRSGGAPEAVRDGETGFVVDGRDVGEIAERLHDLLGDGDLRDRLGAAGREWSAGVWSWDDLAARFRDLLMDVGG